MRYFLALSLLLVLSFPLKLQAQCKYEYSKKDLITDSLTFRTKEIKLATDSEVNGSYSLKKLAIRFEKTSNQSLLEFRLVIKNKTDKPVSVNTFTDSLMLKFDDGETISLKQARFPSVVATGKKQEWSMTYEITDRVKEKLQAGSKVKVMRIVTGTFQVDITEFILNLTEAYLNCWKGA